MISGFPDNCADTEEMVIKRLDKIECSVTKAEIASCHPLKKKGQAIVRFINRKTAEKVLSSRKKLRNINTSDMWGENRVHYVSVNLSPEYLRFRWLAKKLKNRNIISDFGVAKYGVWIKRDSNDDRLHVEIEEDIANCLPDGMNIANL